MSKKGREAHFQHILQFMFAFLSTITNYFEINFILFQIFRRSFFFEIKFLSFSRNFFQTS